MREPDTVEIIGCECLQVVGYPTLQLSVACDERGRPADLAITTDGRLVANLKQFASCGPLSAAAGVFPAIIEYFAGTAQLPFLFLIGLFEVWFVNPISLIASKVTELHRNRCEDTGFYHVCLHEYEGFVLLRYEAGLCKVGYDGALAWHIALKWDDIFIREEPNAVIYSNEHSNDGKEWKISLDDGRVSPV